MAEPVDGQVQNLIDDPILRIELGGGRVEEVALPQILARLLTEQDPIRGFRGLAAEQYNHWYRLMVRCATRALRELGMDPSALPGKPEPLASDLRDALERCAGSAEAWRLHAVVPFEPAFLQPPLPEGTGPTLSEAGYSERGVSILTALIGSKNFERKSEAIRSLGPDELVFALVEFQGGVIFGGSGNYETQLTPSRLGKGSGVPFMGLRLPGGLGATFQHDVSVSLAAEERVRKELRVDGDIWSLWTEAWDGRVSLQSSRLDPAFIPLARLIRVEPPGDDGRYRTVWFKTSTASRVEDLSRGALLGDPFTPTIQDPKQKKSRKVRGVLEGGFRYPEVAELLGLGDRDGRPSDTVAALLAEKGSEARPGIELIMEGVAFEQGKTQGWYRRVIPLPAKAGGLFSNPDPLREAHAFMLNQVREAKQILRSSARIVLAGNPRPRTGDEAIAAIPADRLDSFAEEGDAYIIRLFEAGARLREGDRSWDVEWIEWVRERAREAFVEALPHLTTSAAQRIRREAEAMNHLEARLKRLGGGTEEAAVSAEAIDDSTNEEVA